MTYTVVFAPLVYVATDGAHVSPGFAQLPRSAVGNASLFDEAQWIPSDDVASWMFTVGPALVVFCVANASYTAG
jgi:hypothetical protein